MTAAGNCPGNLAGSWLETVRRCGRRFWRPFGRLTRVSMVWIGAIPKDYTAVRSTVRCSCAGHPLGRSDRLALGCRIADERCGPRAHLSEVCTQHYGST
jgi:hypothetical protein